MKKPSYVHKRVVRVLAYLNVLDCSMSTEMIPVFQIDQLFLKSYFVFILPFLYFFEKVHYYII